MRSFFFAALAAGFFLTSCEEPKKEPMSAPVAPGVDKTAAAKPAGEKPAAGLETAIKGVAKEGADKAATTVAAAMKLEIGCAHCLYKKEGVTACAPAVKMGDKVLLLSGGNVDMAKAGICAAPKQATIEGKVEGDKLVATKVDIAK